MSRLEILQGGISEAKPVVEAPGFSPYINNGGTGLAVAGKGFCIGMADTRMSRGFNIQTRNASKVCQLTSKTIIISCGMQADMATLHKMLTIRVGSYKQDHGREPGVKAVAQMLSTTLYHKRFFPYYTFNIVCGVDEEGNGHTFGYDAIGSFDNSPYATAGTGSSLIMGVMDKHFDGRVPDNSEAALKACKAALVSAAERDIFTGDQMEAFVITSSGIEKSTYDLRRD